MSNSSNFDYNPDEIGKSVVNSRGKIVEIRKYHLTPQEVKKAKRNFDELIKDVPQDIKDKAGSKFFNPYRPRGIYFAQIQALYLLGANEWHSYSELKEKMKEYASEVEITRRENGCARKTNVWTEFEKKTARPDAVTSKDVFGRINENMIFFQRLSKFHPTGYKLRQACAAVDIKRVSKEGFPNGIFYYRLSTYSCPEDAIPVKDISEFTSTNSRGRKYGSRNKDSKPLSTVVNPVVKDLKEELR